MSAERKTLALMSRIRDEMNRYITAELKAAGIDGIVTSHGEIMMSLYTSHVPLTMGDLAHRIHRTKPTVTVLVNKLEGLGYVRKAKNATDARTTNIELTEKGRSVEKAFWQISGKMNRRLHRGLSQTEAATLEKLLVKAWEGLDRTL